MKKKTLVSALLLAAAVGASTTASAVDNPVPALDNIWLSTRLKTTFASNKLVKHNGDTHQLVSQSTKIDSGKDNCFGFFFFHGEGAAPFYELINLCTDATGNWDVYDPDTHFDLTTPTKGSKLFVTNDLGTIGFTANGLGKSVDRFFEYDGITVFEYKLKDGALNKFNLTTKGTQGLARLEDLSAVDQFLGTSKASLTFKWIKDPTDTSKLPVDAIACKNIYLGTAVQPGGRFARCGVGAPPPV